MAGRYDEKFRCSFCGKTQDQVRKLIAGPNGAYICDECVDVCAEIIDEEFENDAYDKEKTDDSAQINLIKPEEMKAFLDEYVRIRRRRYCRLQFIIIIRELWQALILMLSYRRVIS